MRSINQPNSRTISRYRRRRNTSAEHRWPGQTPWTSFGTAHGCAHLLVAEPTAFRPDACRTLPLESTLLLYTDGLIERRTESLDRGMTRLRQQTLVLSTTDVETFCDKLVAMARTDNEDDIAVIALRLSPPQENAGTACRSKEDPGR